jgi:ubiquinone/menaquinone biosynthesis C-methylase UbiE
MKTRGIMDQEFDVRTYNRDAWNKQVDSGENPWTKPVSAEVITRARQGDFAVLLTENLPVPMQWFPELKGMDVLALACGGGQQGPIFAALGAKVTVFDNSPRQLDRDREVAKREGFTNLTTVEGDARKLSMFSDESFDFVFHPVSNVFIPEIRPVWKEAYRVLRHGGILLSGFMNPIFYLFDFDKSEKGILEVKYKLPYADIDHPEMAERQRAGGWPLEYSHSLTDQLGGQTDAGFHIIGLYEDRHGGTEISAYTPTYLATRALKP